MYLHFRKFFYIVYGFSATCNTATWNCKIIEYIVFKILRTREYDFMFSVRLEINKSKVFVWFKNKNSCWENVFGKKSTVNAIVGK